MRAVLYARVSTEEQLENWSVPAQVRTFQEYCEQKGWQLAGLYSEEGKSARSDAIEKRPQFRRLLDDCRKRAFDVVVVHSLDRWSRNLAVTLQSFKQLADHGIAFVSITENIDYSTPEGKLFIAMLGAFAQYFSDSLAKHTSKGMKERALQGFPNGDIPFGYHRQDPNNPNEQKGHIYVVPREAEAVKNVFKHYAGGGWSLSKLAAWLNQQGFTTRNKRELINGNGKAIHGPQPFSGFSVRWLLHNPFYTGKVTYKGNLFPGNHEAVISQETFDHVQTQLKAARGRSKTFSPSYRSYLLKGLVRCIYCGYPLWSETSEKGFSLYREPLRDHKCPSAGHAISAKLIDAQIESIIKELTLDPAWRRKVIDKLSQASARENILKQRKQTEDRLRRLGRSYIDGVIEESEYDVQRKVLQDALGSLVVPGEEAAIHAGEFLETLGPVWGAATLEEKHRLLRMMLECVYMDIGVSRSIVGLQPRPAFYPLFESLKNEPNAKVTIFRDNKPNSTNGVVMVETGES